jgi:hypothetical protein
MQFTIPWVIPERLVKNERKQDMIDLALIGIVFKNSVEPGEQ